MFYASFLLMLSSFALPAQAETLQPVRNPFMLGVSYQATVSAYTASSDETDSRPDEMASGKTVYIGAIANNCLKFGTRVVVGETLYVVEDRMNRRYGCNYYDILVENKSEAYKFGRQKLEIIVIQ